MGEEALHVDAGCVELSSGLHNAATPRCHEVALSEKAGNDDQRNINAKPDIRRDSQMVTHYSTSRASAECS